MASHLTVKKCTALIQRNYQQVISVGGSSSTKEAAVVRRVGTLKVEKFEKLSGWLHVKRLLREGEVREDASRAACRGEVNARGGTETDTLRTASVQTQ